MPRRKTVFANGQLYHLFNRTIAGQHVFTSGRDLSRGQDLFDYYRFFQPLRFSLFKQKTQNEKQNYLSKILDSDPLVELYTCEFMPNHFHSVVKQLQEGGIRYFMSNVQNAFAKYYNDKYKRIGGMFQSPFKAIKIESDDQLKHVIRYNHLNPVTSGLISINELSNYPASTFQYYINDRRSPTRLFNPKLPKSKFISTDLILSIFKSSSAYQKFVFDQADYQKSLYRIKKLI